VTTRALFGDALSADAGATALLGRRLLVNEFDVATSDKLVRCLSRTACFIIEG